MKKLILTAIVSLSSTSLFATSITHNGLDWSRGMSIEIKADGTVRNASAGVGLLTVDGTTSLDVFCVNLFKGITLYQNYAATSVSPTTYDADGGTAAWLMQTFLSTVDTGIEGAALQLAIWDVIHDGGDGFNNGRIRSTGNTNSSVLALANQWVGASQGHTSTNAMVFTAAANRQAFQQQLYLNGCALNGGCGGDSEVPEPGTLAMFAIGALGIYFGTSRK
jgi:hypothetical protein